MMKCGEFSKFAVEWDRNSKNSQNVPTSIFMEKLDDVFLKKHEFFKIAKDSKIVVNATERLRFLRTFIFFPKKLMDFLEKMNNLKIGNSRKFAVECDRKSKSFQNVQFF